MQGEVVGGRFRLEELLETRGMNDLYRGTDRETGSSVAIRVLSDRWSRHAPSIERVLAETRRATSLAHPTLVPIVHVGTTSSGAPCSVMPWLDGTDLGRLLVGGRTMEASDVAAVLSCVASALDALHAARIVHRTLTPSRILIVDREPYVLLGGFGFGPLVAPEGDVGGRPTGTVAGQAVLDYIAPETDRGADSDERVDVYALAAIAFRVMVGSPPFDAETNLVRAIVARQDQAAPTLSESLRAPVPPDLEAVMRIGLAIDPSERYATAGAFVGDLARAVSGQPRRGRTGGNEAVPSELVRAAIDRTRARASETSPFERETGEIALSASPFDKATVRVETIGPVEREPTAPFEIEVVSAPAEPARAATRAHEAAPTTIRVAASEHDVSEAPVALEVGAGQRAWPAALLPIVIGILLLAAITVALFARTIT